MITTMDRIEKELMRETLKLMTKKPGTTHFGIAILFTFKGTLFGFWTTTPTL
jgi:hypothetical protein